jgi:diamine N-acetyltransferase
MHSILTGERTYFRALEPADLTWLYALENDETLWDLSDTQKPYSQYQLQKYIREASKDVYETKQLRFVLCKTSDHQPLGLFDLFDFDPKNNRATVGLVISNPSERSQGFGKEGLKLLMNFARINLRVHQLLANIAVDNLVSINLFESLDFELVGRKKDWIYNRGVYSDVYLYQYIFKES